MKAIKTILAVLLLLSLTACGIQGNEAAKKKKKQLEIYTTVYPLQDFAEKIGGKYVHVHTIYPPGTDEHTFEPSQKDMMKLADEDLFIYIGLGLEGFVNQAKDILKSENVKMVAAADGLNKKDLIASTDHDHHDDSLDVDPHVWLDPVYAKTLAKTIEDALIEKMPEHKVYFEQNYQQLAAKLNLLDQRFQKVAENAKTKEFIVSHAAYGYWEKRYGIKQLPISGISSTSEPSQKQLKTLVDKAKQQHIHYVLFEKNVSSQLAKVVQEELGAKPLTLHNLATRTDKEIKEHQDYFSLMNENLKSLNKALNP